VSPPRVAVVGHVEWLDFAVVDHLPAAGEIVTAEQCFELAAGGGAVAAVQLRKLAGKALFLTALGFDERARRAAAELREAHRVELHAAIRPRPQRRAFTHLDANAERTITVLGDRLVPHGDDALPWERLAACDGVYLTGGDGEAARAARTARVLVATARAADALIAGDVAADVLVASGRDEKERAGLAALPAPRRATVLTDGARGGRWEHADGTRGTWTAARLPGPPVDAYGCGDSFAAGLTYGLAAGMELPAALELAARCGAHCLTGRGPYAAQLILA
jgi:ribokinase